ncbi:acetoin reductase family protein [Obba rivulosa]|uniref:Acetoin reductase family protein n=1 Tax=Obba rivulosa TaxID=1052685 RepID=A0A8E2AWG6_9APHY|nr:acetoin reductase family protein [Obba rivulosa]
MSQHKGSAVVTGGAEGIGRAIAIRLAQDGFDVAVLDLPSSEAKAQAVVGEIEKHGRKALKLFGDVSIEEDVKAAVDRVVASWGGLDVMIANAGISLNRPFHEMTVEDFDRLVSVNLKGVFICYKHAAIQMMKQGRGGRIIGASSIAGKKGMAGNSIYCATKFGVRGLTQSAAMEYGKYGITVNAYAPGVIETGLLDKLDDYHTAQSNQPKGSWTKSLNSSNVLGRNGHPQDVVPLVSFLCTEEAGFITGQTILVDGGICFD